jgi:hypothetical protein
MDKSDLDERGLKQLQMMKDFKLEGFEQHTLERVLLNISNEYNTYSSLTIDYLFGMGVMRTPPSVVNKTRPFLQPYYSN